MKPSEVIVGAGWGASTVWVIAHIWDAGLATFSSFPDAMTGNANAELQKSINKNEGAILPKNTTGLLDEILHPFKFPSNEGKGTFGIHGPITKFFGGIINSIFGSSSAKAKLPTDVENQLKDAVKYQNSRQAIEAWYLAVSSTNIHNAARWVFNQGDMGHQLYILSRGAIDVRKILKRGTSANVKSK